MLSAHHLFSSVVLSRSQPQFHNVSMLLLLLARRYSDTVTRDGDDERLRNVTNASMRCSQERVNG